MEQSRSVIQAAHGLKVFLTRGTVGKLVFIEVLRWAAEILHFLAAAVV